jgi:hypothetical protein
MCFVALNYYFSTLQARDNVVVVRFSLKQCCLTPLVIDTSRKISLPKSKMNFERWAIARLKITC